MSEQLFARHIFKTICECLDTTEEPIPSATILEAIDRARAMTVSLYGVPVEVRSVWTEMEMPLPVPAAVKPRRKRRTSAEVQAARAAEETIADVPSVPLYDASNREHKRVFAEAFQAVGFDINTQASLAGELSRKAEKAETPATLEALVAWLEAAGMTPREARA